MPDIPVPPVEWIDQVASNEGYSLLIDSDYGRGDLRGLAHLACLSRSNTRLVCGRYFSERGEDAADDARSWTAYMRILEKEDGQPWTDIPEGQPGYAEAMRNVARIADYDLRTCCRAYAERFLGRSF